MQQSLQLPAGSTKWSKLTTVKGKTTYTDKGKSLRAGAEYEYFVRAYFKNSKGKYEYSTAPGKSTVGISVITSVKTVPLGSAVTSLGTNKIKFQIVKGAAGYDVYRKVDDATKWTLIGTAPAGSTKYNDSNISAGSRYTYTVKAYLISVSVNIVCLNCVCIS